MTRLHVKNAVYAKQHRKIKDSTCNVQTTDILAVLRQNWTSVATPELYHVVQSPKKLETTRKYHFSMTGNSVVSGKICGILLQQYLICPAIRNLDFPNLKCLYRNRRPADCPERSIKSESH